MSSYKTDDLKGITPIAFDRYLTLLGWKRDVAFPNKKIWRYINYCNYDIQIMIPAMCDYADYYIRLSNAIDALSTVLEKPAMDIILNLKSTYSDRLEFRIISPLANDGKLPLGYASECIQGIKDLILYSACAVNEARPICIKTTNRAKAALGKFELGQTRVGSFIINVDAKVANEDDDHIMKLTEPTPSTEHQIIQRISAAIQQIESATQIDNSITDVAENAYKTGITANMCDSLLKLKPEGCEKIELETTIHYASVITDSIDTKMTARFVDKHFAVIKEIADIYRDRTIIEDMQVVGVIKEMRMDSRDERMVSLECKLDDGKRIIQAILTNEQHEIACDAYKHNWCIRISGVVDKSKKIWHFSDVFEFKVVG